jgi:exodeoxyribonuclease VII small subunit
MPKFEQNLTALESVVERLERGDLSLEDSLKLFEDGVALSAACKTELEAAEGRVQLLSARADGSMTTGNLDVDDETDGAGDGEV